MIGLSLSACIADIIGGHIRETDVEYIVAGTCFRNAVEFQEVIEGYRRDYWYKNPDLGEELAWYFYNTGNIDQPRLRGEAPLQIWMGHWARDVEELKNWPRAE
jgi:hypothetical protein